VGRFRVIRKDLDHRSSIYGDYVDGSEAIALALKSVTAQECQKLVRLMRL
jgi:hypothetical protein